MPIILTYIHVYFINEPTDEFVTIVMVIVVELALARTDSRNESFMVHNTSVTFRIYHILEELLYFIYQIVLVFVEWLPRHDLLPEWLAVEENLYCGVDVADVGILHILNKR